MKKNKRIGIIIIFIIIILSFFVTTSYGFGIANLTGTQQETETLKKAGNNIVKVITTIGTVLSVVMLIILGIKYMIGSTEEKAQYKKSLMPYVIGATFVFAASIIAQIVYDVAIQL